MPYRIDLVLHTALNAMPTFSYCRKPGISITSKQRNQLFHLNALLIRKNEIKN